MLQLLFGRMEMFGTIDYQRLPAGKRKQDAHSEISDDDVGIGSFRSIEDVFWFEISMADIMVVEILDAGDDGAEDSHCIEFGELAAFGDPLEEFSTDCELKGQIVLLFRFEPFVEFNLREVWM